MMAAGHDEGAFPLALRKENGFLFYMKRKVLLAFVVPQGGIEQVSQVLMIYALPPAVDVLDGMIGRD